MTAVSRRGATGAPRGRGGQRPLQGGARSSAETPRRRRPGGAQLLQGSARGRRDQRRRRETSSHLPPQTQARRQKIPPEGGALAASRCRSLMWGTAGPERVA